MLVAKTRQASEQAVLPEAPTASLLLRRIEAQEGRDLAPILQRRVLAQRLVASLEAVGAAIPPIQHVSQRAGGGVLHFEDILVELRRQGLEPALVRDVVVAPYRLMPPALGRLHVVVH